jgi:hypothetical protein
MLGPNGKLEYTNDITPRALRKVYAIEDVLRRAGVQIPNKKGGYYTIVCPLPQHTHHNHTPSFAVYLDNPARGPFWICYGNCGLRGDVIDLVGYLEIAGYDPHNRYSIRQAIERLRGSVFPSVFTPSPPQPGLRANRYLDFLPYQEAVKEYAASRGINEDTLQRFKVGQRGGRWMAIPAFEDGVLRAIKYRNVFQRTYDKCDPGTWRFWSEPGSRNTLLGLEEVEGQKKPILFLKGEIPYLYFRQRGYACVAPTCGEGSRIDEWALRLKHASKIVVVGDNDPNPDVDRKMKAFAQQRAELLGGILRFPPLWYKDIDEWCQADRSAFTVIDSWLEV